MKTIYTLLILLLSTTLTFGQFNITGPNYPPANPVNCATTNDITAVNFFDDGGAGANYAPGQNNVVTICPQTGSGTPKIQGSFGGTGFPWDVHASDTLIVYDGPNINSPVLGKYNNANAPTGFGAVASWSNTSGCLTFQFKTDGANQAAGWQANISCVSPPQDMILHIEGFINTSSTNDLFPLDTGYVDICQGDSVLFVAKPIFPYSGAGYSQTLTNVTYLWEFSDGTVGPDNDSVWYVPNGENGIFVGLNITDLFPHNASMSAKVRISTTPIFNTSGPMEDSVCFGLTTELTGGVTNTDTSGVNIPPNSFQLGGNFAGLTFLPDGSNNEYTTDINMSGFPPGSVVTTSADVQQMCVTMEHSFLGDLEMWLECPNGTEVLIFNSYAAGGVYPGGFGGGGTYLGEPQDFGTGPGNGYEYCFSSVNNNWGTFATDYQANEIPTPPGAPSPGTTVDPNGIYAPEASFAGFAGCPLNGAWTLHVLDSWGGDDGYIFEWGIYFEPSLYPNNETYQNSIVDAFWTPDPTMVSNPANDTVVFVEPPGIGDYLYTFNATDDFGCSYDTTLTLHVLDTIINVTTFDKSLVCKTDSVMLRAKATGTVSPFDFAWQGGQGTDSVMADTAYYNAQTNGVFNYLVTVTDGCGFSVEDTVVLTMNQTLNIDSLIQYIADCGMDNGAVSGMGSGFTGTPKYKWKGPGTTQDSITASVWANKPTGWYYFTIKDNVCIVKDSIFLEQNPPPVADFTATPNQGASPLYVTFVNNSDPGTTYDWDFGNGTGNTVNDLSDQNSTYVDEGVYTATLEITEGACTDETTREIKVFLPMTFDEPNVFTPNGDGENDLFTINAEYALSVEIVIVNRWGNVVFESTDINFAWNGKVNNSGADCSDGTYFYQFKVVGSGDQAAEKQGFIQLVSGK
ncbi:T9SS type B sorting domain-containing protein [Brumimicrobium glaciale]|uniref:T9SS type B sorting domain-containing protein n=1 Tax=Brumimicrobium glaciale TaxID=200475 RepID=A0A4Q4KP41_9FLAO|nr:gliding motility-associated C-terminal domain-containing protein [Brumimicrobium glaciale]RYM34244.1 T9SS type B sorting domain-containing protein [Brumimicrobium glaciale]